METYVINWKGPYDIESIETLSDKSVIYLITGYKKSKRTISTYIGITERFVGARFYDRGHKHNLITREKKIWLGEVKNKKPDRQDLELLESLLVYFWQCDLNNKKKVYPPQPTAVINRWYNKNSTLRSRIVHEAQKLDDVIYWDGEVWHCSKKMEVLQNE
jgi:hypothetical protein